MRRDFSEALPERKIGLWTPWGVLHLDARHAATDDAGKDRTRRLAPPPRAGDRHTALCLTQRDFDSRA